MANNFLRAALLGTALTTATMAHAVSNRTTPQIEGMMGQAIDAIEAKSYIQAQQLLMYLAQLPEHRYSARAQELLGNVREFKGQEAQAVAEYRQYLAQYPDEPGADRVRARLVALLSGRPTISPSEAEQILSYNAVVSSEKASRPVRSRISPTITTANGWRITNRGSASLVYRYNEGTIEIADLTPTPDVVTEEDVTYDNSVTASLNFMSRFENDKNRIELRINAFSNADLDDKDKSDPKTRVSEVSLTYEHKPSGVEVAAGRIQMTPSGFGYRIDGARIEGPATKNVRLGLGYGMVVDSGYDDLFSNTDRTVAGATVEVDNVTKDGNLAVFAVEAREKDIVERQAVGLEFRKRYASGGISSSLEYNTQLEAVSRAVLSGNLRFPDKSTLTARAAYNRSPNLSLTNALSGQNSETLEELQGLYSMAEIEQLALDRSAEITSFGLPYSRKLTDKWSVSGNAAVYDTSGMPASGGVEEIEPEGAKLYAGLSLYGSSVMRKGDSVQTGFSLSQSDETDVYSLLASMRIPFNEAFSVQPRVQVGYRDNADKATADEAFIVPVVSFRYKLESTTVLQAEVGGRLSQSESDTTRTTRKETYFVAGITKSF